MFSWRGATFVWSSETAALKVTRATPKSAHRGKVRKTKAVVIIVEDEFIVTAVSDVIRREHGVVAEGVLNFKVPLDVLGILQVAASHHCSVAERL